MRRSRAFLSHCQFILGPEVRAFEAELAAFCGARHVVTCASGTDALVLALRAKGIGPGDAVLCPSFTFCATAEVVALVGATPVFVDVDAATFNIDANGNCPGRCHGETSRSQAQGGDPGRSVWICRQIMMRLPPRPRRKVCSYSTTPRRLSARHYKDRRLGTFGHATATSFFPAKPLGCYGDGGAVFTDDDEMADVLRSLRMHGHGSDKYDNIRIGLASRLDTVQAAILSEKLKIFPDEIEARNRVAQRYAEGLPTCITIPTVPTGSKSVWAQYTIRLPKGRRDGLAAALKAEGIPTAIYYPIPLHRQQAYKHFPVGDGGVAVSDQLAGEVFSLPMHAYLDAPTQDRIIDATRRALKA